MITETLAAWVPTLRFEALPPIARSRAKLAVFDCCGTAVAGAHHAAVHHVRQLIVEMGSTPTVRIIGDNLSLNPLDAAWLTGTMTDACLYSDTHFPSNAHLTSVLLPVLLVLGELHEITGAEALAAYAAGFEVAARLAEGINPEHYRHGWHTTSVAGVMGATATAGHIMGLSPEQLQQAFGIATSEAAGSRGNFGTDTMPMHSGRAARSGLLSAMLAAKGFTGNPQALESPMGWLDLFRGAGEVRPEAVLHQLGESFALERPELYFKFYANGAPTHRFIDATLALREQGVTPEQVERVVCQVNPTYVQTLRYARPQTPQQARVSLQYAIAVALCDGHVGLAQFNPSRLQAADVQDLMTRVELESDAGLSATTGSDFIAAPATVRIDLRDGRSVTETVEHERGSPQRPPRRPEFEAKFRHCVRHTLPEDKTLLALRYLYQLDTLPHFRMILDALSLVPRPGAEEADEAGAEAPEAAPEPSAPSAEDNRLAALEARLRALEEQK
jgi:2-methylcitrate dehydratase PrpD